MCERRNPHRILISGLRCRSRFDNYGQINWNCLCTSLSKLVRPVNSLGRAIGARPSRVYFPHSGLLPPQPSLEEVSGQHKSPPPRPDRSPPLELYLPSPGCAVSVPKSTLSERRPKSQPPPGPLRLRTEEDLHVACNSPGHRVNFRELPRPDQVLARSL